ncbi:MAG: phenylacetate--CoA ligase family protein, partial [Desulfobacula sp.]|nr:phenylacetate--CoA ligase family protein [Desulfobacula sp.]
PTYALHMAQTAINKLNINPATDLKIQRIMTAGEPGGSISTTKKRIEAAWGARVYDHIGLTEVGSWSYECMEQPGGQHVLEAFFLVEIEDMETGEIIEEPGREGKMIITSFDRLAKPAIRFDTKDVIKWAGFECGCGRSFRLIEGGIIGRVDDITKVKGVLLAPTAIEEVVRGMDELGDEFEIIISKQGDVDHILLKVENVPGKGDDVGGVLNRLQNQLRLKTNLGYQIEICPYESLPRYEIKANRFKDLRKKEVPHE